MPQDTTDEFQRDTFGGMAPAERPAAQPPAAPAPSMTQSPAPAPSMDAGVAAPAPEPLIVPFTYQPYTPPSEADMARRREGIGLVDYRGGMHRENLPVGQPGNDFIGDDGNMYTIMEHGEIVKTANLNEADRAALRKERQDYEAKYGPYTPGQFVTGGSGIVAGTSQMPPQVLAQQIVSSVDPNILLRAVNMFANPQAAAADPQASQVYQQLKSLGLPDNVLADIIQRFAMSIQRPAGTRTAASVLGTPSATVPANPLANALRV